MDLSKNQSPTALTAGRHEQSASNGKGKQRNDEVSYYQG